jgi:hypothetical protein
VLKTVIGWVIVIWIVIWVVHNPDTASTDVHNAWHALFGSAG